MRLNPPKEMIEKADAFLKKIRGLLATNECIFKPSEKNRAFSIRFPLRHEEKVKIIKKLSGRDCIKIAPNDNPRYEKAEVFAFCKEVELLSFGEAETVELYIKMYLNEGEKQTVVVVISFHEEGMYD